MLEVREFFLFSKASAPFLRIGRYRPSFFRRRFFVNYDNFEKKLISFFRAFVKQKKKANKKARRTGL